MLIIQLDVNTTTLIPFILLCSMQLKRLQNYRRVHSNVGLLFTDGLNTNILQDFVFSSNKAGLNFQRAFELNSVHLKIANLESSCT